jgi:hypothetical protein
MRINLRLTQAGKVVGDCVFGIETKMLGVGADESFVEDSAGKLVEVFFFDGLQHASADLSDVGNVVERKFFAFASFAEFVSELTHGVVGNIIGQDWRARYGTDGQGLGNFLGLGSQLKIKSSPQLPPRHSLIPVY